MIRFSFVLTMAAFLAAPAFAATGYHGNQMPGGVAPGDGYRGHKSPGGVAPGACYRDHCAPGWTPEHVEEAPADRAAQPAARGGYVAYGYHGNQMPGGSGPGAGYRGHESPEGAGPGDCYRGHCFKP